MTKATEDAALMLKLRAFKSEDLCIPEGMHESIINYVVYHREPGGFLRAVLCNDLFNAAMRADQVNRGLLHVYMSFLFIHVPSCCWGSERAFRQWIARRASEGTGCR